MRKIIALCAFALLSVSAMTACTETALITDACEADAVAQPVAVDVGVPLATLAGQGAPAALAATLDDPVHKDIQADCAKALAPAAAPVVAPTPVPAVPVPATPATGAPTTAPTTAAAKS